MFVNTVLSHLGKKGDWSFILKLTQDRNRSIVSTVETYGFFKNRYLYFLHFNISNLRYFTLLT